MTVTTNLLSIQTYFSQKNVRLKAKHLLVLWVLTKRRTGLFNIRISSPNCCRKMGRKMNARQLSENMIRFTCSKGHALAAETQHAGKTRACPKCGVPVRIPLDPDKDMDEILEVLFEEKAEERPNPALVAEYYRPKSDRHRNLCRCPHCRRLNPKTYRVCVNCKKQLSIKPQNS